jgi:predicted GIY-YIG superfamily endonuclease
MPSGQKFLFEPEKPLVKRLGKRFFKRLPKRPGIYLMRDAGENIIYVGKAKNLKQRLNSYRTANPDRMSQRHLRLLRQVVRIEVKLCRDESAALAKEAELLRSIRPKFNRAGVWPMKPKVLLWRLSESGLHLKIAESIESDWEGIGPLKGVRWLRLTLARLIWMATHAEAGIHGLPAGWNERKIEEEALIKCNGEAPELAELMKSLNETGTHRFINWVRKQTNSRLTQFENAWLEAKLEALADFPLERIGQTSVTAQTKDEQRMFAFV